MAMKERPAVTVLADGSKYWEHEFETFYLKSYIPATKIDGQVNNYTFRMPLLLVFEENRKLVSEAINFANTTGLSEIAASVDSSVFCIKIRNLGGSSTEFGDSSYGKIKYSKSY